MLQSAAQDFQSAQGTGIPNSVRQQYAPIISQTNADYAQAGQGQSAYIQQAAKQSGNIYNQNAVGDTLFSAGQTLEQSRRGAQQNIAFSEAQAGLTQYNQLLDLMTGGATGALGLGGGFAGLAGGATGFLPNTSMLGAALAGAGSGASAGSVAGPWGTLAGAIIGGGAGAAGYGS